MGKASAVPEPEPDPEPGYKGYTEPKIIGTPWWDLPEIVRQNRASRSEM